MSRYWCYSCESWKVPRAADECASSNHFVVSEEKRVEIEKSQKEGKEMKGILPYDLLRWVTAIGRASSDECESKRRLGWDDYQFFLTWMQDLVKVGLAK